MKLLENKKIKGTVLYTLGIHIICFLVVISSASIWVQSDVAIIPPNILKYCIWGLTGGISIFTAKKLDMSFGLNILLIVTLAIAYMCSNYTYINGGLSLVFIPIFLFYFLAYENSKISSFTICEAMINVLCLMAIVSIVFYVAGSILKILRPTGYYSYEWSWIGRVPSYFNLYFEPMPAGLQNMVITRNCGIYPEAPMYCFPLCVALGLQELIVYGDKKKSYILALTILTTGSTTGILFLIGLYGYKYISKKGWKNKVINGILILISLVVISCLIYVVMIRKTTTGSYSVRVDHIQACIMTMLRTKFLGSGIGNQSMLEQYMSYKQGASVGFLYLLAVGGIFPALMLLIPVLYTMIKAFERKNVDMICFASLFLLLVFLTQIVFRNILWFIVASVFMVSDSLTPRSEDKCFRKKYIIKLVHNKKYN